MRRIASVLCLLVATACGVMFLLIAFTKLTSGDAVAYSLMVMYAAGVAFFYWAAGRIRRPERQPAV